MHTLFLFLQAGADRGVAASDVILELLGFLAFFAIFGALGFRLIVLRRDAGFGSDIVGSGTAFAAARRGAATVGIIGALLLLIDVFAEAMQQSAAHAIPLGTVLTAHHAGMLIPLVAAFVILIGFALGRDALAGWTLAVLGALVLVFQDFATSHKWPSLVNPIHEACAALWLGTLLVLVTIGLPVVFRAGATSDERGRMTAALVSRFSPLALCAAGLLAITGITTAWRHLHRLSSLWTTSYGYTLDIKLVFVLIILALGAWNWKRMTPRLGSEAAAGELRRSATAELTFAGVVLILTAILVSLPSPRA
jgi:putative copper export protein